MLQGMFGKRLAEHFSLLESSSLVLGPKGNAQIAFDTHANAERLSWTHSTHSTRKGFFDIRAPAPSRQHSGLGNVA